MMRFDRLKKARALYEEALKREPPERHVYLLESCDNDQSLLNEVLQLLARHNPSQSPIDAPAAEVLGVVPESVDTDRTSAGPSIEITGASEHDSAWNDFLDQLKSRGPSYLRYEFRGEIARGGMGVVHHVFDQDARRQLALKVIRTPNGSEAKGAAPTVQDRQVGRFLEEAQVTSQLDHPGIVPVHEIGVDREGRAYFTMKLVRGDDLDKVLAKARAGSQGWNVVRMLNVLLRACEALAFAHDRGVVHRDVKPANIMVGRFGEVYIVDWGLARIAGRPSGRDIRPRADPMWRHPELGSTRADMRAETPDSPLVTMDGDVIGTPAYMPPEQARGEVEDVGPRADVYAMGAILYHLLAGEVPYTQDSERPSPHAILAMLIQGPPDPVGNVNPGAPAELVAICEKAMSRPLEDRYSSMEELATDLQAYLENRVVVAYESGALAELKKWAVRNKGITATAVAAAVLIVALTSWFVVSVTAQEQEARRNEQIALREKNRADQNAALATEKAR